jgi:hypothetical protein
VVWESRRSQMTAGIAPFDSPKFRKFVEVAQQDLQRSPLWTCASYLRAELGPKHQLALFQFRTQSSLLADHSSVLTEDDEADNRCDGCETRLQLLEARLAEAKRLAPPGDSATVARLTAEVSELRRLLSQDPAEDWEHAFLHCVKGDLPAARARWHQDMTDLFTQCQPRPNGFGKNSNHPPISWSDIEVVAQVRLALGSPCPLDWTFPGGKQKARRAKKELFQTSALRLCSTFALQICRSLREYKKAVATDLRDGNNDWRTVAGTMDWGPDFSESLTDDDADEISDGSADGEL